MATGSLLAVDVPTMQAADAPIALVNGVLIDGTGSSPVRNAAVLIRDGRIAAVGPSAGVIVPDNAVRIDVHGATILPGFIDAHVHRAFDPANLRAWAWEGVTTVRDEGAPFDTVANLPELRAQLGQDPRNARLVSAGTMIGVYGGYGALPIVTADQGRRTVVAETIKGVDAIKVSLEDGYGGVHGLAKLTAEDLQAIADMAHAQGRPVSGHVTQGAYLQEMLDAGVDDIAHVPCDHMPAQAVRTMVERRVYLIPTFSFLRNVGFPMARCLDNLGWFVEAGGRVALGNDFGGDLGQYDRGMPFFEIRAMSWAGMTPMQIIQAGTQNAAAALHLGDQIGTLETGKAADILVVGGNPLLNLQALADVRLVLHGGEVIRNEIGG